jgi:hypothetical protein
MDKLQAKLIADADEIDARVSPQLQERIAASLHALPMLPAEAKAERTTASLWWASSLTGLAAAMLLLVLTSWNREIVQEVSPETYATVPPPSVGLPLTPIIPLKASTAEFTEPLQDELRKLQADLEKARETVARDLRSSF